MEKIKIIKDQGGRYLLPSKSEIYGRFNGYLYPEKFVNDIELPKSFSYGSVQIPFPEKITIRRECNELVAYRHENGEIISIVEYNEKLREYTDKGYYDSGTWKFGNLDDDYHYKKLILFLLFEYLLFQNFF